MNRLGTMSAAVMLLALALGARAGLAAPAPNQFPEAGGQRGPSLVDGINRILRTTVSGLSDKIVTAAYAVRPGDAGLTVPLGSPHGKGALYTVTFARARDYPAGFSVRLVNTDSASDKRIVLPGVGTLALHPAESATVYALDGAWHITPNPDARRRLTADIDLYMAPAGAPPKGWAAGSDSNDCLSQSSPCATLRHVWNIAYTDYDLAGAVLYIKIADGTYSPQVAALTIFGAIVGNDQIKIVGDCAQPRNVVLQGAANAPIVSARDLAITTLSGLTLQAAPGVSGAIGISSSQNAVVDVGKPNCPVVFGAMPSGYHIIASESGGVNETGLNIVTGGANDHIRADALSHVSAYDEIIGNNVAFDEYMVAEHGSIIYNGCGCKVTYTDPGKATGVRYLTASGGQVSLPGTVIPGSLPPRLDAMSALAAESVPGNPSGSIAAPTATSTARLAAMIEGAKAVFRADLNGKDQSGIPDAVDWVIPLDHRAIDQGDRFDTVTHQWRPPAGLVRLACVATWRDSAAGDQFAIYVVKNGSENLAEAVLNASRAIQTGTASIIDRAKGTDTYECKVLLNHGGGQHTLLGDSNLTYFEGSQL